MSLFNSYDRTNFLGEVNTPLETQGSGVLTPAQQRAKILSNLFDGSTAFTAAQFGVLAGVVPGTAAANKAVVLDGSKGISTITSATITTLTSTTGNVTTVNATTVAASGKVSSSSASAGVGYATGAGGTIAQLTSKATGVALAKMSGAITTFNDALNAATIVSFVVTNAGVAATDVIAINHISGGTVGAYTVNAQAGVGSFTINLRNNTAGNLSEALVLQFVVLKGVNA